MDVIKNVTPETVRAFYTRHYHPERMAVVAVGDFKDGGKGVVSVVPFFSFLFRLSFFRVYCNYCICHGHAGGVHITTLRSAPDEQPGVKGITRNEVKRNEFRHPT